MSKIKRALHESLEHQRDTYRLPVEGKQGNQKASEKLERFISKLRKRHVHS